MADKIVKRGISIFIDGKEITNSVKSIRGEMQKLVNEQAKMTVGADDYVAHAKKIAYLDSLLKEHRENQKKIAEEYDVMSTKSESWMSRAKGNISSLAEGFNKYLGIATAVIATLTGITLGIKKFMDMRMEVDKSAANLKSLTGLGDKDINWLRDYAKELSTTTTEAGVKITATSKEILDGFTVIGSKRPELLKNKEAMAEVTKEALTLAESGVPVEQAFEVVTASMNQFNLKGKDASRIINTIAAGSLEGSAEADSLAGSLKNVGTVANDSNMSLEDTVAMLEVMASKQLTGEEAGTKLRGALLKLKEAGVGYASGQFNVRDALVEVNKKMSEHSSAAQRDAALQKIFGAENVTAGTILLQNVEAYDKLRVAVTGTNTAYRQAKIQSSTLAATLAQSKNKLNEAGMELVKNLNPAMIKLVNMTTAIVKGLSSVISAEKDMTVEFDKQSKKVVDLKMNIEPLLKRYDDLASKTNRSASENAELKKIISEVTGVMPGAVTAVDKYGNAIAISTGRVRDFINTEVARLQVVNRDAIADNKEKLSHVEAQLKRQKTIIDEINKTGTYKYTIHTPEVDLEGTATQDAVAEQQDKYRQLLQDKRGYIAEISRLNGATLSKQLEDARKAKEAQDKLDAENANKPKPGGGVGGTEDKVAKQRKKIDDEMQKLENDNLNKLTAIKKNYLSGDIDTEYEYNQALLSQQDKYDAARKEKLNQLLRTITDKGLKLELNKQLAEIDKAALDRQIKQQNDIKKIILDADPIKAEKQQYESRLRELGIFGIDKSNMTAEQLDAYTLLEQQHAEKLRGLSTREATQKLRDLDKEQEQEEKALSERKVIEKMTEQRYADEKLKIEIDFLRKKLLIQGVSAKEADAIAKSLNEKLISSSSKAYNQLLEFKDRYLYSDTDKAKIQHDISIALLEDLAKTDADIKAHYSEIKKKIDDDYYKSWMGKASAAAQTTAGVASDFSNAFQGFQSAEESAVSLKYDKQIAAAKKAGKDTTKLEEKKESEIGAIKAKWADKIFALNVAQIISSTAVAIMNAWSTTEPTFLAPIVIAGIAASGAAQIAQANAARKQAKAGYYSGGWNNGDNNPSGFTGGTDPREVRGYFPNGEPYHGGEFINNHVTTSNPEVVPLLNLFDAAQKNGTAGSITRKDMAKALRLDAGGYYSGGWVATMGGGSAGGYASGTGTDDELRYQLARLNDHLDAGIKAPIFLHGDSGMVQKLKEYETLLNNSKR